MYGRKGRLKGNKDERQKSMFSRGRKGGQVGKEDVNVKK